MVFVDVVANGMDKEFDNRRNEGNAANDIRSYHMIGYGTQLNVTLPNSNC